MLLPPLPLLLLPLLSLPSVTRFTSSMTNDLSVTVYPDTELGSGSYGRVVEGILHKRDVDAGDLRTPPKASLPVAAKLALRENLDKCQSYM